LPATIKPDPSEIPVISSFGFRAFGLWQRSGQDVALQHFQRLIHQNVVVQAGEYDLVVSAKA